MVEQRRYVSPHQVSQALGVSVTTVKRWVDENRLPAQRTPGGHRKILLDDVLHMVRRENWPHVNLALLTGPHLSPPVDSAEMAQRLYDALLSGDVAAAQTLFLAGREAGLSVARLADEVVSPTMARVGGCWATGQLDVFHEHRATQVCLAALLAMKGRLDAPAGSDCPLALGGGPEFDHYLLANVLAEMVLMEMGWRVVNIGPNTPMGSFRRAMHELKPRLVWISCSYLADIEAFVADSCELYEDAVRSGAAVAVGGRALTGSVRERMKFMHHGDRLGHLEAFARELRSDRL